MLAKPSGCCTAQAVQPPALSKHENAALTHGTFLHVTSRSASGILYTGTGSGKIYFYIPVRTGTYLYMSVQDFHFSTYHTYISVQDFHFSTYWYILVHTGTILYIL